MSNSLLFPKLYLFSGSQSTFQFTQNQLVTSALPFHRRTASMGSCSCKHGEVPKQTTPPAGLDAKVAMNALYQLMGL